MTPPAEGAATSRRAGTIPPRPGEDAPVPSDDPTVTLDEFVAFIGKELAHVARRQLVDGGRLAVIERALIRQELQLRGVAAALNLNTILQEKTMSEIDDLEAGEQALETEVASLVDEAHAAAAELDQLHADLIAAVSTGDMARVKAVADRLTQVKSTVVDSVANLTDAVTRDAETSPAPAPAPSDGGTTTTTGTDAGTDTSGAGDVVGPTDTTGTTTDIGSEPGAPAEPV